MTKNVFARHCILFVLFLFVLTKKGEAQTYIDDEIIKNTHWVKSGSPYIIRASSAIDRKDTLKIEPGVTVKFGRGKVLFVNGGLIAKGTEEEPITITADHREPFLGYYLGLQVKTTSKITSLEHVNISYANEALKISPMKPNTSTMTASHCVFSFNYIAVKGKIRIDSCTFMDNTTGVVSEDQPIEVTNSVFRKNETAVADCPGAKFSGCEFEGNALGVRSEKGTILDSVIRIIDCEYVKNGVAVSVNSSRLPIIQNCRILKNRIGILIKSEDINDTVSEIRNNIICGNDSNICLRGYSIIGVQNNCWCTENDSTIKAGIIDFYHHNWLGYVDFTPILSDICDQDNFIGIRPDTNYSVSGRVHAGSDSLVAAKVLLYQTGKVKPVIMVATDKGFFKIDGVKSGTYQIYVVPDPSLYPDYIPTWYVDKMTNAEAPFLSLKSDAGSFDIKLIKIKTLPVGDKKVHFSIRYSNDSDTRSLYDRKWFGNETWISNEEQSINFDRPKHMCVFLKNASKEIVAWKLTDYQGQVEFSVPGDKYSYSLERKGYVVMEDKIVVKRDTIIELNSERDTVTGVTVSTESVLSYYPNPATETLIVEMQNLSDDLDLKIVTPEGSVYQPQFKVEQDKLLINVAGLHDGLYLLKVNSAATSGTIKFIKH